MHNATLVALANRFEKLAKPVKVELPQDADIEFDETIVLRVAGVVSKGLDNEYTPTAEIPLKSALALFLDKMGFMREFCMLKLEEAMTEALTADADKNETIQASMTDIDEAMERVQLMVGKLPKQIRNGAVRVKVTVDEIKLEGIGIV